MTRVEVRCPNNAGRLFLILRRAGQPTPVDEDNLMELACYDCRKEMNQVSTRRVALVVHRYDFLGSLIDTKIRYNDD